MDKVKEEVAEFEAEALAGDRERMESELGDVLFSIINAARKYGINPENALERTNQKFISRFGYVEKGATEKDVRCATCRLMRWTLFGTRLNHLK